MRIPFSLLFGFLLCGTNLFARGEIKLASPQGGGGNESTSSHAGGSGDIPVGANVYTFSSGTSNVLTLKIVAVSPGFGDQPQGLRDLFSFDVDAIGDSVKEWDSANPNGKLTVSGDQVTATVRFTGIPTNRADLGRKKIRLMFDGKAAAVQEFEVILVEFKESAPCSGFDDTSKPHWLMIPQGKTNACEVEVTASPSINARFAIKPDGAQEKVSPSFMIGTSGTVAVKGGPEIGDTSYVGVYCGTTSVAASKGLRLAVKLKREMKVLIHKVVQVYKTGTSAPISPANFPPAKDLENRLNELYGKQANVFFKVENAKDPNTQQVETIVEHDWQPDGTVSVNATAPNNEDTPDRKAIEAKKMGLPDYDFNVFYIKTMSPPANGIAHYKDKVAYVEDRASDTLMTTVHEIGHLLNLAHPDRELLPSYYIDRDNPEDHKNTAYIEIIPDPEVQTRLMEPPCDSSRKRLIKPEWDIANPNKNTP